MTCHNLDVLRESIMLAYGFISSQYLLTAYEEGYLHSFVL
ncbi:hypothetical protein DSUL_60188 [Desulfovibrionales bacterium]